MNRLGYGIGIISRRAVLSGSAAQKRRLEVPPSFSKAIQKYNELLIERPFITNLVSGGLLGMTGDLICQFALEGKTLETFDLRRFLGMTTFSAFYGSTISLRVFALYPKILPASITKVPWKEGIVSSVIDCLIHSPFLYLPVFYAWTGRFQGETLDQSAQTYTDQFAPVMKSLLLVWIPVQAVNFAVVPRSQRVVFVCCANLVWNCILDFIANNSAQQEEN